MSDDHVGLAFSEAGKEAKPGGYIEPGNGDEERGYGTPLTEEKPVPAKETKIVKKDS
jgi:hypothetical protein